MARFLPRRRGGDTQKQPASPTPADRAPPAPATPSLWASAATGLRGREAAIQWFDGASDDDDDEDDSDAPPPTAPVVIDVDAVPAATPSPPASAPAKEIPWWAEPLPVPIFDTPAERRAAARRRSFGPRTTRTRGTATQRVKRRAPPAPAAPQSRFKRTTRVPRAVAAPAAAPPADPFGIGATVELRGLVSNAAANGRHVVVERTPPDIAAKGRVNVKLDERVVAVKRANLLPVSPAGVGSAPSSVAMGWLTPGFLSFRPHEDWSCWGYPGSPWVSARRTSPAKPVLAAILVSRVARLRSHHRSRSHHTRSARVRHSL